MRGNKIKRNLTDGEKFTITYKEASLIKKLKIFFMSRHSTPIMSLQEAKIQLPVPTLAFKTRLSMDHSALQAKNINSLIYIQSYRVVSFCLFVL